MANEEPIFVPSEVRLSPFKSQNILGNGKLPPFAFTQLTGAKSRETNLVETETNLWILSLDQLWQWNLEKNSLHKIFLSEVDRSFPDKSSLQADNSLIASSQNILYIYKSQTFFVYKILEKSLYKVSFPTTLYGTVKSLLPFGSDLRIITENGAYLYDHLKKMILPQNRLNLSDFSGFGISTQESILYPYNNKVIAVPINQKKTKDSIDNKYIFFKTTKQILGIEKFDDEIFIHTAYSIIRLNSTGKLIQAIPVEQQRLLHQISFDRSNHCYLFTDGLVEIYSTIRKRVTRYSIPPPLKNTRSTFLFASPYLVSASGGMLRVFDTRKISELSLEQNHD